MTAQQNLDAAIDELTAEMNCLTVALAISDSKERMSHIEEVYTLATSVVAASREEREERKVTR